MASRFPKFKKGLAQDPTTRCIWFGIVTAHDFESLMPKHGSPLYIFHTLAMDS
jgi:hypothetical protein